MTITNDDQSIMTRSDFLISKRITAPERTLILLKQVSIFAGQKESARIRL
jgi:hypothetical protein